jgi:ABC-2 type transport system permease protein
MKSLVSAELLKLRSTRSAWIPLAAALMFAVLSVVAAASMAGRGGEPPLSAAMLPDLLRGSGGQLVNGAVLLASIVLSAGEFRHRTSVTTFLGEPRRLRVVSAKLAAAAITGLVVGLAAEALSAFTSWVVLSNYHLPLHWSTPGVRGAIIAVPLLAALYGVLGVGIGLLLRNIAAALGLALGWAFIVEGVLPALAREPGLVRWLPGPAANAVLHSAVSTATTLPAAAALAVLTGYALVLALGAALVTGRREIGTATG